MARREKLGRMPHSQASDIFCANLPIRVRKLLKRIKMVPYFLKTN
jgi:hypothetical protein